MNGMSRREFGLLVDSVCAMHKSVEHSKFICPAPSQAFITSLDMVDTMLGYLEEQGWVLVHSNIENEGGIKKSYHCLELDGATIKIYAE